MFFYNLESEILKWMNKIISEDNISDEIIALNFWIFNTKDSYMLYISWSKSYDKNNDDWACNNDYTPNNKCLRITSNKINNLIWNEFLDLIVKTLKNILFQKTIENSIIWKVEHITTWFDDWNLVIIK